ncbi:hypothetical protein C7974DRAFT_405438, partial [Boeremia exigua]|uniref:uncharacterized protein n=1 Tax=Boeremia exigua TaxID=749465 RepID=UPI001E8D6EA3
MLQLRPQSIYGFSILLVLSARPTHDRLRMGGGYRGVRRGSAGHGYSGSGDRQDELVQSDWLVEASCWTQPQAPAMRQGFQVEMNL